MPLLSFAGDLGAALEPLWSAGAALLDAGRTRSDSARAAGRLDVTVTEGEHALHDAAADWQALEAAHGAATAFQTYAVARQVAQAHLARGERPRIVIVRQASRPAAIFPTVVTRMAGIRVIRFLGDPLIQYGDIVARPGTEAAVIDTAWRSAADPRAGRLIALRKVRADARIAPLLLRKTATIGTQTAPFVWPATPIRSNAGQLRRWRRALERAGEIRFEVLAGAAAADAARETLALKRGWLDARGLCSAVIGEPRWEHVFAGLAYAGSPLRVARLRVGGRTAAAEIALLHERRWLAVVGARAPEFAKGGPGHLQIAETLAWCRAHDVASYDLLAPGDSYKTRLAHGAIDVRDHALVLRLPGLGKLAARTLPLVRAVAARIPNALRRHLFADRLPGRR